MEGFPDGRCSPEKANRHFRFQKCLPTGYSQSAGNLPQLPEAVNPAVYIVFQPMSGELTVEFCSEVGAPLARMAVFGDAGMTSLTENGRYEYELDTPGCSIAERNGVLWHRRRSRGPEQGHIEPGNFVGLLPLELIETASGRKVSKTFIEVRSRKLNYESEYRSMLEDIADRCADFLLQLESPVEQYLEADDDANEATLAQRLYFLKSLLGGSNFRLALQRILDMPNTRWHEEQRSVDIRRTGRLGRSEVRRLVSGGRRIPVPESHPLHSVMTTVPERIEIDDKRDTVDTPENRFVKHALTMFLQTLEDLVERLNKTGTSTYPGLQSEISTLVDELEGTLSHDVFKEVSLPDILPLNSPVLQRKDGYRQVLRAWMMFELAARLSWSGGDDVYSAGKRDAAALYEYWVFFKLLDLISEIFDLDNPPVKDLINEEGLVLKLKAGINLPISGTYSGAGRKLCIEFSYNRTFGGGKSYPDRGSWSRQMRPDYTLSLWPVEFSQEHAEEQELITHVHFDAKYKVDNLVKLFGRENENLDEEQSYEEGPQTAGTYKRADLLKMHAYRDAIRRSAGAYVLYPGSTEKDFRGFHELLPGLGAFPLRPNETNDGSAALTRFLREIVAHVSNTATQREQHTYHTYRIHKDDPPDAVREALPETEYGSDIRSTSPTESSVLVGYYKDEAHLRWITGGRAKLFNCRADVGRGSLRLESKIADASYILLHTDGETVTNKIYRVSRRGPRVLAAETLTDKGYPHTPSRPFYLTYEIEPLNEGDPLACYNWDITKLSGWTAGRGSALPFGVNLAELMTAACREA